MIRTDVICWVLDTYIINWKIVLSVDNNATPILPFCIHFWSAPLKNILIKEYFQNQIYNENVWTSVAIITFGAESLIKKNKQSRDLFLSDKNTLFRLLWRNIGSRRYWYCRCWFTTMENCRQISWTKMQNKYKKM